MIELVNDISLGWLQTIDTIATDVDGTLTDEHGHFSPELISAFLLCERYNIKVILVTGRPASWVQGMVEYLPVKGGIGENGGLYCPKKREAPMRLLMAEADNLPEISLDYVEATRKQRLAVFDLIRAQYPFLKPTGDCVTRLTDFTFPIDNLTASDLVSIEAICHDKNWGFTHSSIHGHIKDPNQHKASGILKTIRLVPELQTDAERVVTVGDSRNDQEMFDPSLFPHSVGVANITRHLPSMQVPPSYITTLPGVQGFCELIDHLVKNRK